MANKTYTMEITLTKTEFEAIANCKPSHKRGNDEGSFNACKKECGYAFCGGKENYNKALYERGQWLFMETYGSLLKDKDFPTDAPKADKPTSTSRGNKGGTVSPKVFMANMEIISKYMDENSWNIFKDKDGCYNNDMILEYANLPTEELKKRLDGEEKMSEKDMEKAIAKMLKAKKK